MHPFAEDWAARGRRLVALDLPGYGLSDKPDVRHGMEEAADAGGSTLRRRWRPRDDVTP